MKGSDQFAFSVFSLAFALKKLVESDYYESKHKLTQDFTKHKKGLNRSSKS